MKQLIVCALFSYLVFCSHASGQTEIAAQRAQVIEKFAKLSLSFEANTGQADKSVKFLSRGRGYGLYLTGEGACAGAKQKRVRRGAVSFAKRCSLSTPNSPNEHALGGGEQ